jgi:hypothetical protein
MDCISEGYTMPGREAVSYLSLKTLPEFKYFTALGKSFGAYGWFQSSTTN